MHKPRVLVIAEAANPEWTSVPLIGWELSRALGEVAEVHLVTQIRNREAILAKGLVEGRDFTAIDSEFAAKPLNSIAEVLRGGAGKGWTTISAFSALSYYFFEELVWRKFRDSLRKREFDLVHRITPLSPTNPSILAKKISALSIPFVIGPLNGGLPWLPAFKTRRIEEREWLSYLRSSYKLMPAYRSTLKFSSAIIAGSKFTASEFPSWVQEKCTYIPENGVNLDRFSMPRSAASNAPLRGAFVGRLVPYKGADILIRSAVTLLRRGQIVLDIMGDGPQKNLLLKIVADEGLAGSVKFHGWIPHDQLQNRLRQADFLALPSVREFGGGVVLEAMALGVTPIVADYGGPAELVDDQTGFKITFEDEFSLGVGLNSILEKIAQSPELLNTKGTLARAMVERKFTWRAKALQIADVYDSVLMKYNKIKHQAAGGTVS